MFLFLFFSGSLNILLAYETERQRQIIPIVAAIDGLQKLYGTDWTPAVVLRSLGLQATNAATFLKVRDYSCDDLFFHVVHNTLLGTDVCQLSP